MPRLSRIWAISLMLGVTFTSWGQERIPFIINGSSTDAFPAVGIVGEASVGGFCTGTLISPNHVLTAAHCGEAILDFGSETTGTFEVGGRVYSTTMVEIIPSYNSRTFTDDVAILVLSEPVPDIEPVELSTVPPEVGEVVTMVGFGGQGTPAEGSDGSFGEKLVGEATVDDVTDTEFSWRFDDASESNPAPGDSGGPVFIDTGETLLLAGIISSGTQADAGLGDTNFNMRVDAFETFITDTVDATQAIIDDSGPAETEQDQNEQGENEQDPVDDSQEEEEATDADQPQPETDVPPEQNDSESGADELADAASDVDTPPADATCSNKGNRHRGRHHGNRSNCSTTESTATTCHHHCQPSCDPADTAATDGATTTDSQTSPAGEDQSVVDTASAESDVLSETQSTESLKTRDNRFRSPRRPRGSYRNASRYTRLTPIGSSGMSRRRINVRR